MGRASAGVSARRVLRAGSLAVVWACCGAASAQSADGISTVVDACVPIDRQEFERLLAIELGTTFAHADEPQRSVARVSLRCVPAGVELRVDDALTRKAMTRVVSLEPLPASSRSRLMALAVAEFLTASWLELQVLGKPPVEPVGPPPSKESIERASRVVKARARLPEPEQEMSTLRLSVSFDLAMFSSEPQLIPCLGLRMTYAFSNTFAIQVAAQVGQAELPGVVTLDSEDQDVQVHLTMASLLLGMLYQARLGAFDLFGGMGARTGLAYVKGRPVSDSDLTPRGSTAPWLAPAAVFGLDYRFTTHLRLALGLEVGWMVLYPSVVVEGDNKPVVELKHVWGSASLGLAWSN